MSFTRRNVAVRASAQRQGDAGNAPSASRNIQQPAAAPVQRLPGTRPSPVDGRPTTSTGCLSLDGLLAGHAGLALGSSVLIGESGTTDYASTLLRYYAAEGVVQGHRIHVVGFPEAWARELPAAIGAASVGDDREKKSPGNSERMKIAWRYEKLGNMETGSSRARPTPGTSSDEPSKNEQTAEIFCHAFDLTKRLTFASSSPFNFIPIDRRSSNPFLKVQQNLAQALKSSPDAVHRIVIPSLLSPAIYPMEACTPSLLLPFLHFLRGLLRTHAGRLSAMLSMSLSLYPRTTGLTRWMELLSDGVVELTPFPHRFDGDVSSSLSTSGAATAQEERPQGMLYVHRLPVFHERGGGGIGSAGVEDDLAFTVSRRKFVIRPFSLPPVEGDQEAQMGQEEAAKEKGLPKKEDLEF